MKKYIEKIKNKENLSLSEIQDAMKTIMAGQASNDDIASFLLALREKGPTIDEITGAAKIMRHFVYRFKLITMLSWTRAVRGAKKKELSISQLLLLSW